MKTKSLPAPQRATNPTTVVKDTLSRAIDTLFEGQPVQCEKHYMGNEMVLVFIGNGACVTFHVQELQKAVQKGGQV
jgi:hypothetical protein